jgi:hypothetical protein
MFRCARVLTQAFIEFATTRFIAGDTDVAATA